MVVFIILSQSQSANMILGFLPPSPSESSLNMGAATDAILSPARVLPVNEIALICGCLIMASPVVSPRPFTIFNTPSGNPASLQILASKKAVIGVTSDGFAITQFPEASAGAIFQVKRYNGRFQ